MCAVERAVTVARAVTQAICLMCREFEKRMLIEKTILPYAYGAVDAV